MPTKGSCARQLASIAAQLRDDYARAAAYAAGNPTTLALLDALAHARTNLLADGPEPTGLLEPVLRVIRCEETSGRATQCALLSAKTLVEAGLLELDPASAPQAIHAVVRAAISCRFEVNDPAADEIVLDCIVCLLEGCICSPSGRLISDELACEVVHSVYRIHAQPSLSELLRESAGAALRRIVAKLFSGYAATAPDAAAGPPAVEMGRLVTSVAAAGTSLGASASACSSSAAPPDDGDESAAVPVVIKGGGESAAAPAHAQAAQDQAPHGEACLREVLHFFVSLADAQPAPTENGAAAPPPAPVALRQLALSLITTAIGAMGTRLGHVASLAQLVEEKLLLVLLQNVETEAPAGEGGPPLLLLCSVLDCVAAVLMAMGVGGSPRDEALIRRLYIGLLAAAPPLDSIKLEATLESLEEMLFTAFPTAVFLRFDCVPHRADLLADLITVLSALATHAPPVAATTAASASSEAPSTAAAAAAAAAVSPSVRSLAVSCMQSLLRSISGRRAPEETSLECELGGRGDDEAAAITSHLQEQLATKRNLQRAAAEFARKPAKGEAALVAAGLLRDKAPPQEVVAILHSVPQIDKASLGDFLSLPSDRSRDVRACFVGGFDFSALTIDEGLRAFLQSFRLPGEAQKIERLMEAFAHAYFGANRGPFLSPDAAFVLSYAIVMLNTDLHSTKVTTKMTCAQFINNNRGINERGDLPKEYLTAIYEAIAANEIRMLGGGLDDEVNISRAAWRFLGQPTRLDQPVQPARLPIAHTDLSSALLLDTPVSAKASSALAKAAPLARVEELMVAPLCWSHLVTALEASLSAARSLAALDRAVKSIEATATLAAAHGASSHVDSLAAKLAAATGLLEKSSRVRSFVVDRKARCTFVALCRLAYKGGSAMRRGWRDVIACILALDAYSLLPADLIADGLISPGLAAVDDAGTSSEAMDGTSEKASHPSADDGAVSPRAASRGNSGLYGFLSYLVGSVDDDEAASLRAEEEAVRAEIAELAIPELFGDSAFLPMEALSALVDALGEASQPAASGVPRHEEDVGGVSVSTSVCGGEVAPPSTPPRETVPDSKDRLPPPTAPAAHASAAPETPRAPHTTGAPRSAPPAVEAALPAVQTCNLALHLLADVALHNRTRFESLWPSLEPCYSAALASPSLANPALLALLRIAQRLVRRDGVLLTLLPLALQYQGLGQVSGHVAEQVAANVLRLVQMGATSQLGETPADWQVLIALATDCALHSSDAAAASGLEALRLVAQAAVVSHKVPLVTAVEQALLALARGCRTADRCERTIDLLIEARAATRGAHAVEGTEANAAEWYAWLENLASFAAEADFAAREQALGALQRAILNEAQPASTLLPCFDLAVFPLATELRRQWMVLHDATATESSPMPPPTFSPAAAHVGAETELERLMLRCVTMLSRCILQHLPLLMSDSVQFDRLWISSLEAFAAYLSPPTSELLAEAVPETLKNMLLVTGASGLFEGGGDLGEESLAVRTGMMVRIICPALVDSPDLQFGLWPMASTEAPPPEKATLAPTDEAIAV